MVLNNKVVYKVIPLKMFFDNSFVEVKFNPAANRPLRRSSFLTQDRPILNFDPENATLFKIWKQKWESWIYMATSALGYLSEENKFHLLISCFSDSTMKDIFELGLEDEKDPDKIIEALANSLTIGKNHHRYRYDFNYRKQLQNESVDSWLVSLKNLAKFAKYDSDCCSKCLESRMLDQLVFGVNSPEVRELLLDVGPDLSLDHAVRLIRKFDENGTTNFSCNSDQETLQPNLDQIKHLPGATSVTAFSAASSEQDDELFQGMGTEETLYRQEAEEGYLRLVSFSRMNNMTVIPGATPSKRPISRREQPTSPAVGDPIRSKAIGIAGMDNSFPGVEITKAINQDTPRLSSILNRTGVITQKAGEQLKATVGQNSKHPDDQSITKRKSEYSLGLEPMCKEPKTSVLSSVMGEATTSLADSSIVFDIQIKSEEVDEAPQENWQKRKKTRRTSACSTSGELPSPENPVKNLDCPSRQVARTSNLPDQKRSTKTVPAVPKMRQISRFQQLSPVHKLPRNPRT